VAQKTGIPDKYLTKLGEHITLGFEIEPSENSGNIINIIFTVKKRSIASAMTSYKLNTNSM
jgi:hypothetical protein